MYRYLLLFSILLICACSPKKVVLEQQSDPTPSSYWYYDPVFQLEANSPLQTEGLYFRILEVDVFGDIYRMFRFFRDGTVIAYVVYNTPDKIIAQQKDTRGNIHGFYEVKQDSVFFTTKVYYDHDPIFYKGQVMGDSLILQSLNHKTKEVNTSTYYYFKKGEELLINR